MNARKGVVVVGLAGLGCAGILVATEAGAGGVGEPEKATMDIHNPSGALIGDGALDAQRPEVLIYEQRRGRLHLVGGGYPPPDAPQPSIDQSVGIEAGGQVLGAMESARIAARQFDFEIGTGFGVSAGSVDGDYMPLIRVQPIYPWRARQRNIEGWVILELTVTEAGTARDPHVIAFEPSEIFNKAVIDAARKFRYRPRTVNGKPVEVRGVRYKMTFQLAER